MSEIKVDSLDYVDWAQEPWTIHGEGRETYVRAVDQTIVVVRHRLPGVVNERVMRRIVAAVNACAGIPTAALEAGALKGLFAALDEWADEPSDPYHDANATETRIVKALLALGRLPS